jgi:hypothetical protein
VFESAKTKMERGWVNRGVLGGREGPPCPSLHSLFNDAKREIFLAVQT